MQLLFFKKISVPGQGYALLRMRLGQRVTGRFQGLLGIGGGDGEGGSRARVRRGARTREFREGKTRKNMKCFSTVIWQRSISNQEQFA